MNDKAIVVVTREQREKVLADLKFATPKEKKKEKKKLLGKLYWGNSWCPGCNKRISDKIWTPLHLVTCDGWWEFYYENGVK